MRDQIEVKIFFLGITMSLGKIREIRDQSPFFREHQFLRILASKP